MNTFREKVGFKLFIDRIAFIHHNLLNYYIFFIYDTLPVYNTSLIRTFPFIYSTLLITSDLLVVITLKGLFFVLSGN